MKNLYITILFYLFVNTAYSQPNCGTPMPLVQDSNLVFVYGKLKVFPPDSIDRMKHLSACVNTTSSEVKAVTVHENGDFWFQVRKNNSDTFIMKINGKPFNRDGAYYPVEIKNITLTKDSLYMGVIPAVPDTFGYYEEWGTVKENKFGGKVHFWTKTIMYPDKRQEHENKLNAIYNSFCSGSDSIFVTKVISESKDKNHFWSTEERKLTIKHQDLLSMSEYFTFVK